MAAPRAVREATERANKLIAEGDNTDPGQMPAPPAVAAVPDDIGGRLADDPDSTAAKPADQGASDDSGTPGEPAPGAKEEKPEDWKNKYLVLQGKYNKEIKPVQEDNDNLRKLLAEGGGSGEVEQLRSQVAQLTEQLNGQPTPDLSPELVKMREDYGSELVDGLMAQFKKMINPLTHRIDSVDKSVDSNSAATRVQSLRSIVIANGIDFDIVNDDPMFVDAFLGRIDQYSGRTLNELMQEAFKSGDLNRAAKFFTDFVAEQTVQASNSNTNTPAKKVDIGKHVQVDGKPNVSDDGSNAADEPVWTDATIKDFYKDKMDGKFTPEEAKRLEQDLFKALDRAAKQP